MTYMAGQESASRRDAEIAKKGGYLLSLHTWRLCETKVFDAIEGGRER